MDEASWARSALIVVAFWGLEALEDGGLEDVDEDYLVVGVEEDFGEELAYETASACDEDLHCGVVKVVSVEILVILVRDCMLESQRDGGNDTATTELYSCSPSDVVGILKADSDPQFTPPPLPT
jgi:hypothetical protein